MAVCRWLNLHYCKAISDKGLLHLATLVGLAHLDIGFCSKLTDRQVRPHARLTTQIRLVQLHFPNWQTLCQRTAIRLCAVPQLSIAASCVQSGSRHLWPDSQYHRDGHNALYFCRGMACLATLPYLTHVRMAGCPRIRLYQESQEVSAKVDIRLWAGEVPASAQRMPWTLPLQKMLCACGSVQSD